MSNDLIELTDTELDAVTGGFNLVPQINIAHVTGVAFNIGGFGGGNVAAVEQQVEQVNSIGSFASLF